MKFYLENYSSNLMQVCLVGNYELDRLEVFAKQYFEGILNKQVKMPSYEGLAETFSLKGRGLSRLFHINPDKDSNLLQILWPKLPSFSWESKVNNYLTHVLGHEGPNSLLSELVKEGFATGLMASSSNRLYNRDGEIKIDITLTKKGVKHFKWVLSLVFAFI